MGDLERDRETRRSGLIRIDLHIHTRASRDCLSDYADVLEVARRRKLDRIAITDHNEIEGAFRARDLDGERVIVGEEIKTAAGADLTGLFLREAIPPGLDVRETAQAIREQRGLVYVPHPFAPGKGLGAEVLESITEWVDVIEVFNARVHRASLNERAGRWAAAHGLPGGAGSDAHTLREIGRGTVEVAPFEGPEGLRSALADGRVVGRVSGYWVHAASTWAKLARKAGFEA